MLSTHKFSMSARNNEDANRLWTKPEESLDEAMAKHEERTLSKRQY